MKGFAMDLKGNNSGQVKVEPMSSSVKLQQPTSTLQMPLISVKKEFGGRLASFKPPRDLSCGTSSSMNVFKPTIAAQASSKKVFAPNVNVTRRKGPSAPVVTESTSAKNVKSTSDRGRRNPRSRGNFVQTQGIFSEGLGVAQPKAFKRISEPSTTQIEKPKLNLNRTTCKSKEDSKMKEILKDDFIDDPKLIPDLSDCPTSLPMLLNAMGRNVLDLDATFESLQMKTEKPDDLGPRSPKILKLFQDDQPRELFIFQFPDEVIRKEIETKAPKVKQEKSNNKTQPVINEESHHRLSHLGEGRWGTLRILENGTAYIAVGKEKIPIELTRHCPRESVMSVELDPSASKGELVNLGPVSGNFTCFSDLNLSESK